MTNLEQPQAELRATTVVMVNERDANKRRELLGECEHIEAAIEHERVLAAITKRYQCATGLGYE